MNPEVLSIFISSREKELIDERQIAIQTIKKMGFNPISSENRPASDEPIEKINEARVARSDIYVGIFGEEYSQPTIDEYRMAISKKKPTLVFKKNEQNPDDKLSGFIEKIKSSSTGNAYKEFNHVVEFRKALKDSIVYVVSRDFRKPYAPDMREVVKYAERPTDIPIPMLGTGEIKNVELADVFYKGDMGSINVQVEGQIQFSFLDLLLVDPAGKQFWYPNPVEVDQTLDRAIHPLQGMYRANWNFEIYEVMKPGSYVAFVGLYEDTYNLPTVNRRLVHFKQQSVTIKE